MIEMNNFVFRFEAKFEVCFRKLEIAKLRNILIGSINECVFDC